MLRPIVVACIAALAYGSIVCRPASAIMTLNASWMVTYYLDPNGVTGATECINFRKTGTTNGVITGTWRSPTFPSWRGSWVQKGQHYSWYGTWMQNGQSGATFDVGDILNDSMTAESSVGSFTVASPPVTQYTGTATMVLVPSCSGAPVQHGQSPLLRF